MKLSQRTQEDLNPRRERKTASEMSVLSIPLVNPVLSFLVTNHSNINIPLFLDCVNETNGDILVQIQIQTITWLFLFIHLLFLQLNISFV